MLTSSRWQETLGCFEADKVSSKICQFHYISVRCDLKAHPSSALHWLFLGELEGFRRWQEINPGDVRLNPTRHNVSLTSQKWKKKVVPNAWVACGDWQQAYQLPGTYFLEADFPPRFFFFFTYLKSPCLFLWVAFSPFQWLVHFFCLSLFPLFLT